MRPYELHPDAGDEVEGLIRHFDQRPPGRGAELREAVVDTIEFVCRHPKIGTPHGAVARKRKVNGFPVMVYYVELPDRIWVVAVPHAKRRPNYWIDRLNDTTDPTA